MEPKANPAQRKPRKKTGNPMALILMLIVIIGIGVAVAAAWKGGTSDKNPGASAPQTMDPSGEISTPVGKLTFPKEWAGDVRVKDTSTGNRYAVSFYGTVGQDTVFLFELTVGEDGSGYELGSAPDANGNYQRIWLNISEIHGDPAWPEEEVSRINTMQSCVNDLIEQLREMEGYRESD